MSLNKKTIATAICAVLFAGGANAAVTLGTTATNSPVTVATEAFGTADASGAIFTNAANALDIITPLSYAFSNGEVRYARIECGSNVKIDAASAVAYTDGGGNPGTATLGAINGSGTNAISFSVTATAAGVGDNAGDIFTLNGNRTISSPGTAASCSYSLYDQPSQAQAGGATGRIANTSGAYINFASGYTFSTSAQQTLLADVEASTGAFTKFTTAGPVNATLGRLSNLRFDAATGTQIDEDGLDITLADIFGANTSIDIAGDFSFTAAAVANVFLATDDACSAGITASTSKTASSAKFTVGSTAHAAGADERLCVIPNTTTAIPEGSYTATLNAVVSNAAEYSVSSSSALASGSINRNGTSLQAPFVQLPGDWLSRMVLTNTGSLSRPYTITVFGENGNTITTANTTGTVPANGTTVVDLSTVLTGFSDTTKPRGTLNVTVAAPNSQIQGLYQIVNPDKGSISNHVMVRAGSN